jgi:hypothetical protein
MSVSPYASEAKVNQALTAIGAELIGQNEQQLLQQLVVAAATASGGGGGGGITLPVSIANGGTGSTTATTARVALGVDEVIPAVGQVVDIFIGGSVTMSWIAEYFDIDAVSQVYRFWFTVDGSGGSPPSPPPGGTAVQVNLTDGMTPEAVATAIASAMATYPSELSTSNVGLFGLNVTNVVAGPATAPASYATSISVNITTNGANATTQLVIADASIASNKLETPGLTINTTYVPLGGSVTLPGDTADQIRDKLITLTGVSRLPASAVKDLPSGAGWEMVQNATASSSANVIFDSIFSSGYEWRIRIEDCRAATTNTVMYLMPRAGGADLGTTETGRSLECFAATSTATTASRSANAGVIPFGSAISNLYKNNFILSWRPDANTRNIIFDGFGSYNQTATSVSGYFTGVVAIAAQPTGIKILFAAGNITEGKFAVERRPITAIP